MAVETIQYTILYPLESFKEMQGLLKQNKTKQNKTKQNKTKRYKTLQIASARKAYYNLLSQIKLFELKKRTNIRM